MLLHGALEEVLPALAASLGAATVLSEAEVEYRWAELQTSLPGSSCRGRQNMIRIWLEYG